MKDGSADGSRGNAKRATGNAIVLLCFRLTQRGRPPVCSACLKQAALPAVQGWLLSASTRLSWQMGKSNFHLKQAKAANRPQRAYRLQSILSLEVRSAFSTEPSDYVYVSRPCYPSPLKPWETTLTPISRRQRNFPTYLPPSSLVG